MFEALHTAMGFNKKRWRFIFEGLNYDKEKDSNYSSISFLLGDEYDTKLWIGGKIKTQIIMIQINTKNGLFTHPLKQKK